MSRSSSFVLFFGIVSLFVFGFFFIPTPSHAQGACEINQIYFDNDPSNPITVYQEGSLTYAKVVVTSQNCTGETFKFRLQERTGSDKILTLGNSTLVDAPLVSEFTLPILQDTSAYTFSIGEQYCNTSSNPDCNVYIQYQEPGGGVWKTSGSSFNNLRYDCDGACDDSNLWYYQGDLTSEDVGVTRSCKVESIKFVPETLSYNDDTPPDVDVQIVSSGCEGRSIRFSIAQAGSGNISVANRVLLSLSNPVATLRYRTSEELCTSTIIGNVCTYKIIYTDDFVENKVAPSTLTYSCDGTCDTSIFWELASSGGVSGADVVAPHLLGGGTREFDPCVGEEECYTLLAPLPFEDQTIDADGDGSVDFEIATIEGKKVFKGRIDLSSYINVMVQIVIGILGLASVVMIIYSGMTYMTTHAVTGKSDAREKLLNAVIGLCIALGAYIILATINPNLLNLSPGIDKVTLEVGGDPDSSMNFNTSVSFRDGVVTAFTLPPDRIDSVYCPLPSTGISTEIRPVALSFVGNTTYRYGGKGGPLPSGKKYAPPSGDTYKCPDGSSTPCRTFCPADTLCIDCSGYVNHVLRCSGYNFVNGGSGTIFRSSLADVINTITESNGDIIVNGEALVPGDLVGSPNNHVAIYIGNGEIAHSTSKGGVPGRLPENAIKVESIISAWKGGKSSWLKRVRRLRTID